ncbi:DUF3343 domain-containing protein [Megamonas hypermegale]|uniref:DUF3343 domain-containing protein n=1 Tax=Megamonas hypermegale TaxID=158847 RepID=UPI00255C7DF3|nr:DUF3343 domain-containing protein [Megamonas hypermegale]
MKYIATFYSHFGAIRFKKLCDAQNITAKVMPVPRDLSSSCGTCVKCEGDLIAQSDIHEDEIEQIVEITDTGYRIIYKAENS